MNSINNYYNKKNNKNGNLKNSRLRLIYCRGSTWVLICITLLVGTKTEKWIIWGTILVKIAHIRKI